MKNRIIQIIKSLLAALSVAVIFQPDLIHAQEILVVDVKRNITLSDSDPVYKDFYLSAGDGSSLKKNLVVNVKRKITIKESATKNIGDFETVVGQLKVIHVGNKVSVAREFKLTPRDEEPMLEQIGIMAGDKIDLAGSFVDYSKPKRQTAESETTTQPAPATAGASTPTPVTPAATENSTLAPKPTEAKAETVAPETRSPANSEPTLLQKIIPMPNIQ
jgi:hypothetical protein